MPTLVDVLLDQPAQRPAVHAETLTTTADVVRWSARLANALHDRYGVTPGERVALLLEPGPGFLHALYGVWRAGAAALVLTPLHPPKERARLLQDADARLVIASPTLTASAEQGAAERVVTTLASEAGEAWSLGGAALPPAEAAAGPSSEPAAGPPSADDLALLVYTSGTTGRPKGVMLRHCHLHAQCAALRHAWGMRADDVLIHALPLHHVHGLVIALLTTLAAGGSARMLPRFDAAAVLAACASGTVVMGVPTMYARLVEALDALAEPARAEAVAAIARLRLCISGSAALPVSLGERWARYAGAYPVERFGMSELGVALSNRVAGPRVPGSVGWPLPGVRVRVVDEHGRTASEGELQVAGPTVFDGYWRRHEETERAFVVEGGVRWFRTGDTVRLHDDGRLQVLGRTSVDILKSAGYKLSAIAIEEALRAHPEVRDAAVVGLPDETYGQRVAAAVMLRPGATLTVEALLAFAREELPPYALPRLVRFVDDVPRNTMSKVRKPALTELLARSEADDRAGAALLTDRPAPGTQSDDT